MESYLRIFLTIFALGVLLVGVPAGAEGAPQRFAQAQESQSNSAQRNSGNWQQDPAARKAARRAEKQTGGRALAVTRVKEGYRVRLLLKGGRVTTVVIRD
jgi:hypothetical protein